MIKRIKKIKTLLLDIYITIIRYINGNTGNVIRYNFYKNRMKYLGKNVIIDTGVFFGGCEYIFIDDNTHIDKNCIIIGSPENIDLSNRVIKERYNRYYRGKKGEVYIGKNCHISQNTMIYGYGGVSIGDKCCMSVGSKVYSLTSIPYNPYNKNEIVSVVPYSGKSPTLIGPVVFQDNVWIGIDCIVSPGVALEENCFVKTMSIVNSSFEKNSYIGGIPARRLRNRFGKDEI